MRGLLAFLLALLFAFGLGAPSAQAQANIDADPLTLIKAIYQTYATNQPLPAHIYSQRLQALIDKDEKETPDGYVGHIDWDVFVDAQDTQLTKLKIALLSKSATHAQVRATFKNFDEPCAILFDLVREDGGWRIDEIQETARKRWIMSKILADAPDAFPGDPPPAKTGAKPN